MTKSSTVLHYTNIDSANFAPWCEFPTSPLEAGQKYRLTADLVEGDFYFKVADNIYLTNSLNLTFTNNSVDFITDADKQYMAFGVDSSNGNYPFNVHIENLKLYKVIENQ